MTLSITICKYAERHVLSVVMLYGIILCVVMLSIIMLSVVTLNVIMLNVVKLSAMASFKLVECLFIEVPFH